ncbi:MAG: biotin--[acetyl-CoA-carboxylase] ligase [Cyanobacteria bacterium P01_G01_bin.54]
MNQFSGHLDASSLALAWQQTDWPPEFAVPKYQLQDCVDSTNPLAWERILQSNRPQIVIARQQTAGQGQWGREWRSPLGGLYLSLGLPHVELPPLLLSLVTAWGIAQQLQAYHVPIALKWPNDLLVQGRKLGGIKVETRHPRQSAVVIGVGINGANPVPRGGISLQDCSEQTFTSLASLAAVVSRGILRAIATYPRLTPSGFLAQYWEQLETKQRSVSVAGGQGKIIGLTPQGQLKVRLSAPGASTTIICKPGEVQIGYPDRRPDRRDDNDSR